MPDYVEIVPKLVLTKDQLAKIKAEHEKELEFADTINKARVNTPKKKLPDFILQAESIVIAIDDIEEVEEFYDFALNQLADFQEFTSQITEECPTEDSINSASASGEDEDPEEANQEADDSGRRLLQQEITRRPFVRNPDLSIPLLDRLVVSIEVDDQVEESDAAKMRKFSWKIGSVSDKALELDISLSHPGLFN